MPYCSKVNAHAAQRIWVSALTWSIGLAPGPKADLALRRVRRFRVDAGPVLPPVQRLHVILSTTEDIGPADGIARRAAAVLPPVVRPWFRRVGFRESGPRVEQRRSSQMKLVFDDV